MHWFLLTFIILKCECDYLYMSCHDNPNIIAYNVNTSSLFTSTLLDISGIDWISSDDLHFRGLAIQENILYVANSKKSASFIGEWQCNTNSSFLAPSGLTFLANFTGLDSSNPGLVHPYGIRLTNNNFMYVTTQDTQSLLLYDSNGKPDIKTPANNIYPGSIVVYGPYNENGNGVRDVAIDHINNLVFVAEELLQMVLCYDASNNFTNIFNITYGDKNAEPIGLRINQKLYPNTIFIGDNGINAVIAIQYEPKLKTFKQLWQTKSNSDLKHPAGIDVNDKFVFVVEQDNNLIMQFESETGKFIQNFVDFSKLGVTGENLLYVQGNGCS